MGMQILLQLLYFSMMFIAGIIMALCFALWLIRNHGAKLKGLIDENLGVEAKDMELCRIGEIVLQSNNYDAVQLFALVRNELGAEHFLKYLGFQKSKRMTSGSIE